jgi:para-nitrobenzyl esterase
VEALGASVASRLGCTDPATALACLRRLPVEELLANAQPFQPYAFGNPVLPEDPGTAFREGRFARVPVLAGGTRDEHRLFVGLHRVLAEQVPTFAYEFADRQAPMYLPFPPDLPPGAFHSAEVPYLFPDDKFLAAATPAQRRLSDRLQQSWASFARGGDPAGPGLPAWPRFDGAQPVPYVQSLAPGDGVRAVDYAAEHQLGFWEAAEASSPGRR